MGNVDIIIQCAKVLIMINHDVMLLYTRLDLMVPTPEFVTWVASTKLVGTMTSGCSLQPLRSKRLGGTRQSGRGSCQVDLLPCCQ